MIETYENFLDENNFKKLEDIFLSHEVHWNFAPYANDYTDRSEQNAFHFFHHLVHRRRIMYDTARDVLDLIIPTLANKKDCDVEVTRGRLNFFIRTQDKPIEYGHHQDIMDLTNNFTCLLYMEDSNGYTHFRDTDEKIFSKRNMAAIFPAHIWHQTVSQTDVLFRRNVNINFEMR